MAGPHRRVRRCAARTGYRRPAQSGGHAGHRPRNTAGSPGCCAVVAQRARRRCGRSRRAGWHGDRVAGTSPDRRAGIHRPPRACRTCRSRSEPLMEIWDYFRVHQAEIWRWTWTTVWLAGVPLVIGLLVSLPIGWLASRFRWTYPPVVTLAGILYTIPSLVLFILLPGIIGTKILDPINVAVALTVYTVALLVRTVADGLSSVSSDTLS